jgi:hypothetical protein
MHDFPFLDHRSIIPVLALGRGKPTISGARAKALEGFVVGTRHRRTSAWKKRLGNDFAGMELRRIEYPVIATPIQRKACTRLIEGTITNELKSSVSQEEEELAARVSKHRAGRWHGAIRIVGCFGHLSGLAGLSKPPECCARDKRIRTVITVLAIFADAVGTLAYQLDRPRQRAHGGRAQTLNLRKVIRLSPPFKRGNV